MNCVDFTDLWPAVLLWLLPDLQPFSALFLASRDNRLLLSGVDGAALLRARLGAPSLVGSASDFRCLSALAGRLHVAFGLVDGVAGLSNWDGAAKDISMQGLARLRDRFPEALIFLWQTRFPPDALVALSAPQSWVTAEPCLELRIGTATVKLSLRLLCVAEPFFQQDAPLSSLLARLELDVDHGNRIWPGGSPGPNGHEICGDGHRWSCMCTTIETGGVDLFSGVRESYLRPCWRDPRIMKTMERPMQHSCHALNGETTDLAQPLRLALIIYRTDCDEGPDSG